MKVIQYKPFNFKWLTRDGVTHYWQGTALTVNFSRPKPILQEVQNG